MTAPKPVVTGHASAQARMTWMDTLRGVAIGLVILWHSAAILLLWDLPVPAALLTANEFFSPYRMPTLMFLSGMLLPASLRKSNRVYYLGKLRFVAYPLAIWTVIHYVVYRPDVSFFNAQFLTTTYLWFLLYILIYYLVSPLIRWLPTWVAILAPLLVGPLVHETSRRRFFFLAAFFFLGKLVAEHRPLCDRIIAAPWSWMTAPIAVAFGIFSAVTVPTRYQSVLAIFSVAGIVTLVKISQAISSSRATLPLQYAGRNSLVYYVTHFPTIVIVVLIGQGALGLPIDAVIALGFVAAVAVGTLSSYLSERSVLHWLFGYPAKGDLQRFADRRETHPRRGEARRSEPA